MAENITEIEQLENQNSNNNENTVIDETNVQSDNVITNKIIKWKEKLIDLTRRNRLLNFKSPKNASIKIIDEIPTELFRILVANSKQMKFLPIKDNAEDTPEEQRLSREALNVGIEFKAQEFEKYERESLASKHIDNYLQTNLPEKDLTRTLRKISTAAKTAMDDLGYNTLFLTLGSVEWYESDYSDVKYESPLILLPIRLVRNNMNDVFRAEYNDDDIILNPALVLQFKKEFHIILDDLVTNEIDDTNILKIFETVQERISIKKRWKLYNNSYIGLFSFAKFVMYKDLEEHTDIVKKSSLVKSICGFGEWQETNIEKVCPVKELDKNFLPKDNFSILDADSSQQQAILDIKEAFNVEYETIDIKTFEHKINSMLSDIEDLTVWNQYLNAIDNIEKENLTGFYNKFLNSNIDFNKIDKAFEVQFLRIWLNCYVYAKSNVLREFNTAQHNNLIKQFKELDTNLIKSAKLRLCQILHDDMINGKNNFPKELADLEHESKLQRLRKSLRQIINMIPNLLLSIKPCLMMSPLTVSQLLDPAQFNFDYIIFDEASQLTTEDCIGSMIRGKRLIVAGDEQQLPPTSFFKSVTEPSEDDYSDDDEKEDLESILVECQTSSFPKCMLKWHYRSKDEHLIAFSNKHLYRELYTFPSSVEVSDITGIKWHYYENTEHNEKNALQAEARMVAKAAIEHAKRFPTRTLAVATFNVNQKSLIEDEINELLKTEKDCMDFFDDKKTEPFFVKNLESIQGDERDVIFISMGRIKYYYNYRTPKWLHIITKNDTSFWGDEQLNDYSNTKNSFENSIQFLKKYAVIN